MVLIWKRDKNQFKVESYMYIKKIHIQNYKAIKELELEFLPGVNLLIGDNGVGKTSILEAISVGIAGMLKGVAGVPVKNILQNDIHFNIDESGDASSSLIYKTPARVACNLQVGVKEYSWERFRLDEMGNARTKMEDNGIVKWMQEISNDATGLLPILCYQSDARVWQMRRGDFGKELRKKLNDRRCGYIGCLDYSLDIKGIQQWCLKMELNAFQKRKEIQEYEFFKDIVAGFMQKISDLEKRPEIYYSGQIEQMVYREGEIVMPISNLSAGYQSLIWMVMNLAYRLAQLNPDMTLEMENVSGIVLIDEIDMHLHPKWQWNIIKALEETFPKVQFILATHSPIVISSCKNERLIMLDNEQEVYYMADAYGYSVQDVLNFRQGTSEKPKNIKKLSQDFENAMENEEFEVAEGIIGQMEKLLGKEHADVRDARAELVLNRWEE